MFTSGGRLQAARAGFTPPGRETSDPFSAQTQLLVIASQGAVDLKGLTTFDTHTAPLVAPNALDVQAFQFAGDASTIFSSSTSTAVNLTSNSTPWTAEAWIRPDRVNVAQTIISQNTVNAVGKLTLAVDSAAHLVYLTNVARATSAILLGANSWAHVAICHVSLDGSVGQLIFVNGKMLALSGNFTATCTGTGIALGSYIGGASPFKGLIDSWRVTNAQRYTADFTPLQFFH